MVAVTQGIQATILSGKETTWGTAVSATKSLGLVTNWSTADEQGTKEHYGLGQAKAVAVSGGLYTPKGSIDVELAHGRMIEYAIYGGATTSTDSSTDCTHTFVYANTLPSFTVEESYEQGTPDIVNKWAGVTFNSSTLSLTADGELTLKSDWLAKTVDVSSTSSTAASIPTQAPIRGLSGALSLGTAVSNCASWEITCNRNMKIGHALGSRVPAWGGSNLISTTWKATVAYDATTWHQKLLGGTTPTTNAEPTSFTATFTADNNVALGSGKKSISIALTGCQVTSHGKAVTVNDFVMQDITGVGILGTGSMVDNVLNAAW